MIAYRTKDLEGDVWCEQALLFESNEKATEFFNNPLLVLETLGIELEDHENINNIGYEVFTIADRIGAPVAHITFECEYCGRKNIAMMLKGHVIK